MLNQATGEPSAATGYEPTTGHPMEVTTAEPGVQFYDGTLTGKGGVVYGPHAGFYLGT